MNIEQSPISMFDRVRIHSTPLTQQKKAAGLIGVIYGITTPSNPVYRKSISSEIIGELTEDRAYGVHFEELDETLWFAAPLVEFVDNNPGVEIQVGDLKAVRLETGEWQEQTRVGIGRKFLNYPEMMLTAEERQGIVSKNGIGKRFWDLMKKMIFPN